MNDEAIALWVEMLEGLPSREHRCRAVASLLGTHAAEAVREANAEVERLRAELAKWQRFASYCRCCALCGESDPQTFEQFVDYGATLATQEKQE